MSENETSKAGVSRRAFLGGSALALGAAAVASTGVLSGCTSTNGKEDQGKEEQSSSAASGAYEVYETDVCIVGGGLAGIHAAIEAMDQRKNVIIVEKAGWGFGGAAGYNWDQFINFTRDDLPWDEAGDFVYNSLTSDEIAKATYEGWTHEERNLMLDNARLGETPAQHNADGTIAPLLDLPTIYGIYRGFPRAMHDTVRSYNQVCLDHTLATDYIVQDGKCYGVMGVHIPTGTFRVIRAKAVVCCTGASAWMYGWKTVAPMSINSPDNTGDLDAAAFRHGCRLEGSEFFQNDLINIVPTGIAASFQAGIGADSGCCKFIMDKDGNRFFEEYDYASLNKMDFTRIIAKTIADGKGSPNGGVYVDFSTDEAYGKIGETYIRNIELWKQVFGITVKGMKMECALEAYERSGNPEADKDLMLIGLPGVFHPRGGGYCGAQGGSSVNVAARNGAFCIKKACEYASGVELPALDESVVEAEYKRVFGLFDGEGGKNPYQIRRMIQKACYQAVQPARITADMEAGLEELKRIRTEEMPKMVLRDKSMVHNNDWKCAIENWNLLDLAQAAAASALYRKETRGHMYRVEYPEQLDEWEVNVVNNYNNGDINCETKQPVKF